MPDLSYPTSIQNRWAGMSGMSCGRWFLTRVSQMLAELMLPDQVHNREEDWTIFFLHKGPDEEDPDGDSGLMYVLSLVNKKLDQSVKRYFRLGRADR
jgi:hypothetical protein